MTILRAGLYERVSTEEQALRGYSIDAQIDNLTDYCKTKGYKIVDHYTDEGISGAKPPLKRPALKRLIDDVIAGKIDIVIFTKLDRWFRSVQEYFKVQEILEKHRVEWKAIHEDYDTTSANGRMAITIFLAIAQNEREKTGERIKVVFDHKRKNKEICFGGRNPFGYMKKEVDGAMRLVKNPEEQDACQDFWKLLLQYHNINKAAKFVNETYGLRRTFATWSNMIRKEFYSGNYNGVEGYCEGYVTPEEWKAANDMRPIKKAQKGRVYLFSSMIICPGCGNFLSACTTTYPDGKEYRGYRCRISYTGLCSFTRRVAEMKTEKFLLANVKNQLLTEIERTEAEKAKAKPKPKTNVASLKEQLRRLNVTYMAGAKPDNEYLEEAADLKARIAKAEQEATSELPNLEPLKQLLDTGFLTDYHELDPEHRRMIWRNLIKEIHLDDNNPCKVIFKGNSMV